MHVRRRNQGYELLDHFRYRHPDRFGAVTPLTLECVYPVACRICWIKKGQTLVGERAAGAIGKELLQLAAFLGTDVAVAVDREALDEPKSLMITTNLVYSEWDKVFLSKTSTAAAVDRSIHKCETFNIQGPSWRAETAKKNLAQKTKNELALQ